MAHWVNALAAKPDNLSSIPSHMIEGENWLLPSDLNIGFPSTKISKYSNYFRGCLGHPQVLKSLILSWLRP